MRGIMARLRTLLCLAMALALLVPAAASSAHALTHGLPAATADGHRHGAGHAADAAKPGDAAPQPDRHDGGHDHLLSLSFPVGALFEDTPLVHPPLPVTAPPTAEVATLLLRPAEPPPADPPRAA